MLFAMTIYYIWPNFVFRLLTNSIFESNISFSLSTPRVLPHVRTSRGVGPSSLSQCIEDLLGEWEELKAHYSGEKSESASPLHRVTSNEDQSSSKTGEIEDVNLRRHLNQAAQMYTRMQFWKRETFPMGVIAVSRIHTSAVLLALIELQCDNL